MIHTPASVVRKAPLRELLFWTHILVILFAVSTAFLFPLPTVVVLTVLHRAHVVVLGGCALTRLQRSMGLLPEEKDFLQLAAERLFNREITRAQSRLLDYFFVSLTLMLSVLRALLTA